MHTALAILIAFIGTVAATPRRSDVMAAVGPEARMAVARAAC
jgi:hypothetical protein